MLEILLIIILIYFSVKRTNKLNKRDALLIKKDDRERKIAIHKQELSKMDKYDYKEHHHFWIQQWEFEIQCINDELKKLPKK